MQKDIFIYNDEGVSGNGIAALLRLFGERARLTDADEICRSATPLIDASLFIMPGGADLPYCRKLNGAGNRKIRDYVEDGGIYLGICAGAYYGCRLLEYHKGRDDEISGSRELAFYQGTAYGSLGDIAPYYDGTLKTAAITSIKCKNGLAWKTLYHGGPAFRPAIGENTDILASYQSIPEAPAIIQCPAGNGRAILTGVHIEYAACDISAMELKEDEEPIRQRLYTELEDQNPQDLLRLILGEGIFH